MRVRIGIRELRDNLTGTIRRVRRGEVVEVPADGLERLVAGGDVRRPAPLERPLRRFPVTGSMSASEAVEDDRAER